jgi:site-specific recombinase XerD
MSVKLRARKLPSGRTVLFLDIYHKGTQRREALGLYLTSDRKENKEIKRFAEARRAKRELEIHSGEYGIENKNKKRVNVFQFAKSVYNLKSERTAPCYRNSFTHLREFGGNNLTFDQLTPRFCENFKSFLLSKQKLNPNTASAYLARFKSIIHKAIKDKIITQNPAEDVSIRKQEALPKYLTLNEIQQLEQTHCGNEAVKDAFLFSCLTGLRYEDVESLTWSQIRDGGIEFTQKKTDVGERLPLTLEAVEILEKQRTAVKSSKVLKKHLTGTVFLLPARQTIDKVLKAWAKRAQFEKTISFHKARHSFATLALNSGVDIYTISKLLGHKNVETTAIYAKVVDEKKKEAVTKLPRIR